MWKSFNFKKEPGSILAFFFLLLFGSVCFFFPFSLFSDWVSVALLLGIMIGGLFFLSPSVPVFFIVLVFSFSLNYQVTSVIPLRYNHLFDFLIQWGLFFWGLEIGSYLKKSAHSYSAHISKLFYILLLGGFVFLFFEDWKTSLLIAVLLSSYSFFYRSSFQIKNNFISYLLFLILIPLFFGFIWGVKIFIIFLTIFLIYSVYEIFFTKKIKKSMMIFIISFLSVFISYSFSSFPVFLAGIFAGKLFYPRNERLNENNLSYLFKALLMILFFIRIKFIIFDILISFMIVLLILFIHLSTGKRFPDEREGRLSLELSFSFLILSIPFQGSNIILLVLFFETALAVLGESKKGFLSLFHSIKKERKNKLENLPR